MPQPPGLLLAILLRIALWLAGTPRSVGMLMPMPLLLDTLFWATDHEVEFRSMPDPWLYLASLPMIVSWLLATGPLGPKPAVRMPSLGSFGDPVPAFSTVRPVTVT